MGGVGADHVQQPFQRNPAVGAQITVHDVKSKLYPLGHCFPHRQAGGGQRLRTPADRLHRFRRRRTDPVIGKKGQSQPTQFHCLRSPYDHGHHRRISSVAPGNDGQRRGKVFHMPRQKANRQYRRQRAGGRRKVARGGHQPVCRFVAGDAAIVGRYANAAAGVAAEPQGRSSRRNDGRLAAATAPRRAAQIMGIVSSAVHQVVALIDEAQFRHIGLPEENGTTGPQPGDDSGILLGHVRSAAARSGTGHQPCRIQGIFDGKGHPVQRPEQRSLGQQLIGSARLPEGRFGIPLHDGIQARIDLGNPFKMSLDQFFGRHLFGPNGGSHPGRRYKHVVGRHS